MLQERSEHQEAENRFAEAVALNAKDAEIRRSYAESLWRIGKKQDSIEQLTEALTLASKPDTRILLSLSEKCYDLGYYATAVDCAEKAIDSADAKWAATEENRLLLSRAWVIRARVHWRNGKLEPALNDYHKAISFCPKDRELLSELAALQSEMGQPERALATWHSAGRLWPPNQEPLQVVFGRGNAYMAMQQYHLACDQFALANQRWPEDITTYCQLAKAQLASGRTREAAVVAQRAVEISPQNPVCLAIHEQVRVALAQPQQQFR
ncbi:MAG: tetratricopeptide repeat protein [Planctomycetaceae bacterium]|nr:tetratricopeptide repeat protein [Planctomycetaceae bacterium]